MMLYFLPLGMSLANAADLRVEAWSEDTTSSRVKTAAEIFVDGQSTGLYTPNVIRDLDPGSHEVELRSACAVARQTVTVVDGGSNYVELELKTLASLSIEVEPSNADVQLDGSPWDLAAGAQQLPCGEHTVSASLDGYQTKLSNFQLAAGEVHGLSIQLTPLGVGILRVEVEPDTARVVVNGEDKGRGSMELTVYQGPHVIEAFKRGYVSAEETLFVAADDSLDVRLLLQPESSKTESLGTSIPPIFASPTKAAGFGLTAGGAIFTVYGGVQLLQTMSAYSEYKDRVETVRAGHREPAYAAGF